ncbi:hypothetical protein [Solimonas aquatica]|uniref:hypothetical protein n=1 Tax=Solimonas aquatica TaxID=489703 RepID=UPI0011605FBC|nr:hypothetical protein [Solimonas aquatica]
MKNRKSTLADQLPGRRTSYRQGRRGPAVLAAVLLAAASLGYKVITDFPGAELSFYFFVTIAMVLGGAIGGHFNKRDSSSGYGGHEEESPTAELDHLGADSKGEGNEKSDGLR